MAAARTLTFQGRSRERAELNRALDGVRAGGSAVLVLKGEAGIGKTTLLEYLAEHASGCRTIQLAGAESELDLPFAALHQLCAPLLDGLASLPQPQAHALQVAFGLAAGTAPDRLVVGLAMLSLLAEAAARRPLVCLIDDAQWLDQASGQVLGFVGRRLLAESVLLVFAMRTPAGDRLLTGLPELAVDGLTEEDAGALLDAALPGHLDAQVRDRIVAETRGNPLALLELARRNRAELLGGFALPPIGPVPGHLQESYLQRIRELPAPTRQLMLLAAAEPTADATLLWRAATTLGLGPDAAAPADVDQLLTIDAQVRFWHSLVRSAAYRAGSAEDRRTVHRVLAGAIDPETEPERRVWHLAAAATGPDEAVAAELERSAVRVQARGGAAATAAFLQRSVALTADPGRRAERALAAAHAQLLAGAFAAALGLLAEAAADATGDLQRARIDLLKAQVGRAAMSGRDAPGPLLQAARRLEPLDLPLARVTYLDAWSAALVAGSLAPPEAGLLEVSRAARSLPPVTHDPGPGDLLLDGLATLITEGNAAAAPRLRRAVDAFLGDQVRADQWLDWGILAANAALALWDLNGWEACSSRHVEHARASGALAPLANALNVRRVIALWRGDVEAATALGVEEQTVKDLTGTRRASYGALFLAAYQGRPAEAGPLLAATASEALSRGEGLGLQMTDRATALLHNGLGHYAQALAAAERAAQGNLGPFTAQALPDLIEAAARSGQPEQAGQALRRLTEFTAGPDSDWAAGLLARSRALLSEGDQAEECYTLAVERLSRTRLRFELARARLVFGEWLRRERRRSQARDQLRAAFEAFAAMGANGFADRARRELLATGEKVRKRRVDTLDELTPQEEHIARMARDGRTNPEIGAELFISARTVEWHLRKVFAKLGITSRRELRDALPARRRDTATGLPSPAATRPRKN